MFIRHFEVDLTLTELHSSGTGPNSVIWLHFFIIIKIIKLRMYVYVCENVSC